MKIFVTGGNGFVGSAVVRKLLDRGHHVRCLLRATSRIDRIAGLGFERVPGDVRDLDSLRAGMKDAEAVLHLASLSNWSDIHSPRMPEVVVGGTSNVLATAAALGKPRVVFVSSCAAINGTRTPELQTEESTMTLPLDRFVYIRAKLEAERLCREHAARGLPVCIVNPAEVYGPNDIDKITAGTLVDFAKSSPVVVSRGGTSVVHVDDVADGILAAMERGRPGERYILGGDNLTIHELATLTLQLLGQRKSILTMPTPLLQTLAWLGTHLKLPLPFNPAVVPYAVRYWFMDNTKAKTELGVTFRSATAVLEPTLDWVSKHLL